jgi:hypothetical protein
MALLGLQARPGPAGWRHPATGHGRTSTPARKTPLKPACLIVRPLSVNPSTASGGQVGTGPSREILPVPTLMPIRNPAASMIAAGLPTMVRSLLSTRTLSW